MVDMACGLCENYFMERVQAKQVKQCYCCSVAAGFIDKLYIFLWAEKHVVKMSKAHTTWEDNQQIESNTNRQREEDTLIKTDQHNEVWLVAKWNKWHDVADYCIQVTHIPNKKETMADS